MGNVIVLMVLAIGVVAVLAFVLIKYQEHRTSLYERRITAQAHLLQASRPVTAGAVTYIMRGLDRNGHVLYDTVQNAQVMTLLPQPEPQPSEILESDPDRERAMKLIQASIDYQGLDLGDDHRVVHDHGAAGTQLLTSREAIAAGVFTRNDDWQSAIRFLCQQGCEASNKKDRQGVFAPEGKTLQELRLNLAVGRLPRREPSIIGRGWTLD